MMPPRNLAPSSPAPLQRVLSLTTLGSSSQSASAGIEPKSGELALSVPTMCSAAASHPFLSAFPSIPRPSLRHARAGTLHSVLWNPVSQARPPPFSALDPGMAGTPHSALRRQPLRPMPLKPRAMFAASRRIISSGDGARRYELDANQMVISSACMSAACGLVHAYLVRACLVHACLVHACLVHACLVHAFLVHALLVHASRITEIRLGPGRTLRHRTVGSHLDPTCP